MMVPLLPSDFSIEFKLNCINEAKKNFRWGVLIERAHYCAILAEEERTIGQGVLIEKGALTEGVRLSQMVAQQAEDQCKELPEVALQRHNIKGNLIRKADRLGPTLMPLDYFLD